jgi:hypothetical protein
MGCGTPAGASDITNTTASARVQNRGRGMEFPRPRASRGLDGDRVAGTSLPNRVVYRV